MAIVRIDPAEAADVPLVQVDSSAGNLWLAIGEIDDWASDHGFVRTSESHLRRIMVDGHLGFRGICYRPTPEESVAADHAQRQMIARADRLQATAEAVGGPR